MLEKAIPTEVSLPVKVDGVEMTVHLKSGEEDPHARAQSFCSAHNIDDSSCARRLGDAFQKHMLKHNLETTQHRSSSPPPSTGTAASRNKRHPETHDIHLSDSSLGGTIGQTKGMGTSTGERLSAATTPVDTEEDIDAPQMRKHPIDTKLSSPVRSNGKEDGAASTKVPNVSRKYQQSTTVQPSSTPDQQLGNPPSEAPSGSKIDWGQQECITRDGPSLAKCFSAKAAENKIARDNGNNNNNNNNNNPPIIEIMDHPSIVPASQHRPTILASSRGNDLSAYGAESLGFPTNQRRQQQARPVAVSSERLQEVASQTAARNLVPGGSLSAASSTARSGNQDDGGTGEQKIREYDGKSAPKGQESRKRTVQEVAAEMKAAVLSAYDPSDPSVVFVDMIVNGHAAPLLFRPPRGLHDEGDDGTTQRDVPAGIAVEARMTAEKWCLEFGSNRLPDIQFVEEETKKAWRKMKATRLQRRHDYSDANPAPSLKRQRPHGGLPNTYNFDTAKHDAGRAGATSRPSNVVEHGQHTNRAGVLNSKREAAYPIRSEQQQQQDSHQQSNRGEHLLGADRADTISPKRNGKINPGADNRGMTSDETRLIPTSVLASDVIEGTSLFWVQVSESLVTASSSSTDEKVR